MSDGTVPTLEQPRVQATSLQVLVHQYRLVLVCAVAEQANQIGMLQATQEEDLGLVGWRVEG